MNYDPSIFTQVTSLHAAKRIILTDEATQTTDMRWERETPHICDLIDDHIELSGKSVVIDYGCGVGRISRELIRRHDCNVIGVDIAPNMLALAASYVASDRLVLCQPQGLSLLNLKADIVIAVWVLQHVADLSAELARIKWAMKSEGRLFVVNEAGSSRFLPTLTGWVNDGVNVEDELDRRFHPIVRGHLRSQVVGEEQSERTFWSIYRMG